MSPSTAYTVQLIQWQEVTIEVRYAERLPSAEQMAHVELVAIKPARAAFPISETGYKSHFTPRAHIENAGGVVAFVTTWLAHAERDPDWIALRDASRQGSLF